MNVQRYRKSRIARWFPRFALFLLAGSLCLAPVLVQAQGFESWTQSRLSLAERLAGLGWADANGDGDEAPMVFEYVFERNPAVADGQVERRYHVHHAGESFRFPRNPDADDVALAIEVSSDLSSFQTAATFSGGVWTPLLSGVSVQESGSDPIEVAVSFAEPATTRFSRLRAVLPAPANGLQAVIRVDEPEVYATSGYFSQINDFGLTLTRGYAPFAVFFQGWESSPRNDIVRWAWDFGPGTEGDEPGRTFEGFNAAHVFETPGTYTVTLRVASAAGEWSAPATVTVEVLSRETARTFYVDAQIGDDAYDGLSPTVNGMSGPFRTATKAFAMLTKRNGSPISEWPLQPGDQVLFRRGQTFSLTAVISGGHGSRSQGVHYGAYGDPALPKPRIQWEGIRGDGPTNILGGSGIGVAYLSFADLHIDFFNRAENDRLAGLGNAVGRWKNVTCLRMEMFNSTDSFFSMQGNAAEKVSNWFFVSCDMGKPDSYILDANGVNLFGSPGRLAILNTRIDLSGNHCMYFGSVDKAVLHGNVFSRPAFGRTALRFTGGAADDTTNNILISDNHFLGWIDPCTEETCPGVGAGSGQNPHNGGGVRYHYELMNFLVSHTGERLGHDIVFERNVVTNYEVGMDVGNIENLIIRNNVFLGGRAINLGSEIAAYSTQPLRNVKIVGNAFFSFIDTINYGSTVAVREYPADAPTGRGSALENIQIANNLFFAFDEAVRPLLYLEPNTEGVTINHNLYHAPGSVASGGAFSLDGTRVDFAGWQGTTGHDAQSAEAQPQFTTAPARPDFAPGYPDSQMMALTQAMDLLAAIEPTGSSPVVDQGIDLAADLLFDLNWNLRPAGTAPEVGPFETASTSLLDYTSISTGHR